MIGLNSRQIDREISATFIMLFKLEEVNSFSMDECKVLLEFLGLYLEEKLAICHRMYQLQVNEMDEIPHFDENLSAGLFLNLEQPCIDPVPRGNETAFQQVQILFDKILSELGELEPYHPDEEPCVNWDDERGTCMDAVCPATFGSSGIKCRRR